MKGLNKRLLVGGLSLALSAALSPVFSAEPVKIGAVFSLSGIFASPGQDSKRGAEQAAEAINAAGGIKSLGGAKLELVFGDTQSKPASAASETERLITQSKVAVVIGANTSGDTIPLSVVTERYGVPLLASTAQSEEVTNRGFKWLWSLGITDAEYDGAAIAALHIVQKQRPGLRRVAIAYGDNETGQNAAKIFKEMMKKETTFELAADIQFSARAQDFTSTVLKMREAGVQMVVMAAYLRETIAIARAFDQLDYHPVWICMAGGTADSKFQAQVGAMANGVFSPTSFGPDLPKVKSVYDTFEKKFGFPMPSTAAMAYVGVDLIARVLELAGSTDAAKVAQAFRDVRVKKEDILTSHEFIEFDSAGRNKGRRSLVVQWQDGKLVTVWPADIATQPPLIPRVNVE